jgi:hypothetical protein
MQARTILTPVDTGCFEYWCNRSWDAIGCHHLTADTCTHAWSGRQCVWDPTTSTCWSQNQIHASNCSQWPAPEKQVLTTFAGTLADFDHLILPAVRWWNGSVLTNWRENLVGQMARMFLKWDQTLNVSGPGWSAPAFTPATSIENFWEAEVLSPQFGDTRPAGDVKLILGLFDELYGTEEGTQLRDLCRARGWALVWALGPADAAGSPAAPGWTNGQPIYPSNERWLDPTATGGAGHNLSLPVHAATTVAAKAWAALSATHRTMSKVREQWRMLQRQLPAFGVQPLYGLSCADLDCIGITAHGGDCVCY